MRAGLVVFVALNACARPAADDPVEVARAELAARRVPHAPDPTAVREGLAGSYVRFAQTLDGVPVLGGDVVVRVARDRADVFDRRVPVTGAAPTPALDDDAARAAAGATDAAPAALALDPASSALVWVVDAGFERVLVDAVSGEVLDRHDRRVFVDGTGLVFDPNPVASSGNTGLTDGNDANQPALTAQRRSVTLPRLDGTGVLRGAWVDAHRPGTRAQSGAHAFAYDRAEDAFEEVMTYFHLDRAQDRIQSLGHADVLARRLEVIVNGSNQDNSWYDPSARTITTGTGGVDDAEDGEILVHEYGHAIHDDQAPGFLDGWDLEPAALGEGFGDYLAASFSDTLSAQVTDPACVGDWDAVAYADPPCLRRVDGTRHYPEHLVGESHADGEIWSATLWDLRARLGADLVDALVFESQFAYGGGMTVRDAGDALLDADEAVHGGAHRDVIRRVLVAHGVSRALTVAPAPTVGSRAVDVDLANPLRSDGRYDDDLDDTQTFTAPGARALRVHFDAFDTELHPDCHEGACDNVYLTNGDGDLFQVLAGPLGAVRSAVIAGDTVNVRLVTDAFERREGYHIDRIDVFEDDLPPDPVDTGDTATDTADSATEPADTATDTADSATDTGPGFDDERIVAQRCGCRTGGAPGAAALALAGMALARRGSRRRPR